MNANFKVSYYLRSNYQTKEGKTPVMIRIFLNGEMLNFGSSGLGIEKKLWNTSTQRAKGRSAEALNINSSLDVISSTLQNIVTNLRNKETLSLDKIKSVYHGKDKEIASVFQFYDKYLEDMKAEIGHGKTKNLYNRYAVVRRHFTEFLDYKYLRKDLAFTELTPIIIDGFFLYLKTVPKLQHNSAIKILKVFKTVMLRASKYGLLDHDPFMDQNFHQERVDRGFLTDEELRRLMQKEFDIKRLDVVRDLFVFSCFCGLAYTDMSRLTTENIVTLDGMQWIIISRQKTNVSSNIPLLEIPKLIIQKYNGTTDTDRLLPSISNQKINSYLKEIADLCGIKKRLSYHLARHTFATMALSKGIPIESVSKMLGHTNIRTTQIYARAPRMVA